MSYHFALTGRRACAYVGAASSEAPVCGWSVSGSSTPSLSGIATPIGAVMASTPHDNWPDN
jgi:hypothetical protein